MRELNWPKHLASRPSAFRQRGLVAAGLGIVALGGLAVWLNDRSTAEADVPKIAQRPTTPVLPPGIVVERDSSKAIEWYKKAVEANVPMARHNLALLLRDGKGAARNVPEAIQLLRAAAKQGMAASMFTLGDIYERGDAGAKDQSMAL